MVKSIINVRFLDMLAWSEELITDVRTKSWLWRHCVELAYRLLRSPSQTCHAKPPNSNWTGADGYQLLPVGGMPTASSLAWRLLSESQDAILQQIKERGALLMIDRGDIRVRQSTVAAISGLHCRALVMVSSSIRLTAWLQNSKKWRAVVREIDVWAESPRLSPLWLSASSSACRGLLIITVITPLPTKPSATKMPENWLANAAITDMQMRQRDVAALDAKYTKELADAKAEMMLCVMMLPLVVGCTSGSSLSVSSVKLPPPPAWIMQPPPDWQTPLNGIISPSERGWSLCKNNWKEPQKYINEQR